MITLLLDHLRGRRVTALATAAGLLALTVGYLALFPQLEEQLQTFAGDLPEFYKALIGDANFATAEGYVRTQVYSLTAPLIAAGVTVSAAAGFAKAERDVTLTDAYLAPISRRALGWSFLAAAWTLAALAGAAVFVGVAIGAPLAGAEVSWGGITAATVSLIWFAWAAAAVAWAVGVATGSPGAATGAGWGFIAVSFVANSVGEVVSDLAVLTDVSPWGWYGAGAPIDDGFQLSSLGLLAVALVLAPVGAALLERRDLQL